MFVSHRDEIEKKIIENPAMKGVVKQVLIGPEQGWKDYVMRLFTLSKGGYAPRHTHPWQHIMYVVEGEGKLFMNGIDYPLVAGSVSYVPAEVEHQVMNAGDAKFVFICIVPEFGDK
ncbi:MAG: cupin [Spirochaetae bacterium HGW-Spirochaetae-8]|nr:MAG: cupin [Spirochaetae bacterium HGW-Spirochaetae-8]